MHTCMCFNLAPGCPTAQLVAMLLYAKHQGVIEYCITAGCKHKVKAMTK